MDIPEVKPTASNRKERAPKYRSFKNAESLRKLNEKISNKLQPALSDYYHDLQAVCVGGTTHAIQIAVTTRGIGLNTAYSYDLLRRKYQKFFDSTRLTVFQAYRVSLAQLDHKLKLAKNDRKGNPNLAFPSSGFLNNDFREQILACKDNFTLVAGAINIVGNVKYNDQDYVPFVPKLEPLPIRSDSSKKSTSPAVRPDPFLVTLYNLRSVVEALSDVNTPHEVRTYFESLSPIPGAVWNNHLITNADDIIPADYDDAMLADDVENFNAFVKLVAGKDNRFIGPVNYESTGETSLLMTTSIVEDKVAIFNAASGNRQPDLNIYSRYKHINQFDPLYGIVMLMGEYPPVYNNEGMIVWTYADPTVWIERARVSVGYTWNSVKRAAMVNKVV